MKLTICVSLYNHSDPFALLLDLHCFTCFDDQETSTRMSLHKEIVSFEFLVTWSGFPALRSWGKYQRQYGNLKGVFHTQLKMQITYSNLDAWHCGNTVILLVGLWSYDAHLSETFISDMQCMPKFCCNISLLWFMTFAALFWISILSCNLFISFMHHRCFWRTVVLTLSPPRVSLWRVKSSGVRPSKIYKWPLVVKGLREIVS